MENRESDSRRNRRKDGINAWPVLEKKGHIDDLKDMGLAFLGDSPDSVNVEDFEDIENRSPNLGKGVSPIPSSARRKSEEKRPLQETQTDTSERKRQIPTVSSSASKRLRQSDSTKKTHDFSPQTTCDAHPDLHKPPSCLPRLVTFDDGQITEEPAGQSTPDRTYDDFETYFPEIESPGDGVEEKECFVAHNKSFCNSKTHCHHDQDQDDQIDGYFSQFSDEVMLSILQWLPKRMLVRCMLVCKRWYRLASDGRLWARVDLGGRVLPPGALPTILTRNTVILRLATANLHSPVLSIPPIRDFRIQYLDLTAASITPDCLSSLLNLCTSLLKLSLEGLFLNLDCVNSLSRLTQLRTLNLALVTGLRKRMSKAIKNMERLESLNIAWTNLTQKELDCAATMMPKGLLKLNISGCRNTMQNTVVEALVARCPNLIELDLSDSSHITDFSIKEIVKLNGLEHLALSRCYSLGLNDYLMLPMARSLKYVEVFGLVVPLTLANLQKHLPQIQFNKFMHSSVARPTVGNRRTSIWGLRTRDQ